MSVLIASLSQKAPAQLIENLMLWSIPSFALVLSFDQPQKSLLKLLWLELVFMWCFSLSTKNTLSIVLFEPFWGDWNKYCFDWQVFCKYKPDSYGTCFSLIFFLSWLLSACSKWKFCFLSNALWHTGLENL